MARTHTRNSITFKKDTANPSTANRVSKRDFNELIYVDASNFPTNDGVKTTSSKINIPRLDLGSSTQPATRSKTRRRRKKKDSDLVNSGDT